VILLPEREGLEPLPELIWNLDQFSARRRLERSRIRVLDWGCGTGVAVQSLWQQGWDVYGVDIEARAVDFGNTVIGSERLFLVDEAGRTRFPDGYFDFVYSQAVFEHVVDPLLSVHEIRRISANSAGGLHILPAPFMPIEPHIAMPFVHWLPKNRFRRLYILGCCQLGIGLTSEINKRAVRGMDMSQKVDFEYEYLDEHTFYRQFWQLGGAFRKAGFRVSYPVLNHHKLAPFRRVLLLPGLKSLAGILLLTFVTIHIETKVGD